MPVLSVPGGRYGWLEAGTRSRLEREVLPDFLRRQRWFAGKARALDGVSLADVAPAERIDPRLAFALVEARFGDGGSDLYFLPLAVSTGGAAARIAGEPRWLVAELDGPEGRAVLHDATADPGLCSALLDAIGRPAEVRSGRGAIKALKTDAYGSARGPEGALAPVRVGGAEQSNTTVLFGDRLILKLFRRLEPGINPDFEIGRFLTERARFDRVPQTAGALEYHRPGVPPATLAILQRLVPNQGSGWEHALAGLARFYAELDDRADAPPSPGSASPLDLADLEPPPALATRAADALADAEILGRRTAEMHRALACDADDPDFAPRPMTPDDLHALASDIRGQVEATRAALGRAVDRLPPATADEARLVLGGSPGLLRRLERLEDRGLDSTVIRVHGDYHLGQVLRADGDYYLLDFEGEPAKPLARRREKQSPIKDVVGMLRSFDYAAHAGMFEAAGDRPDRVDRLAAWARAWQTWASARFLRAYLRTAGGASFLPRDRAALAGLLDAYTLDKAMYELLYELNNRPDWVRIPLRGVVALIEPGRGGPPASS